MQITEAAVSHILTMMKEQGREGECLRLGVKTSGCSGLEYVMEFAPDANPGDQVVQIDRLRVLMDTNSTAYLDEITLDWGSGLLGSGFKFENPNASRTCGCGKSFSV